VFILYAVIAGLIVGAVTGGRLERMERLRFRWPWLAIGGLVIQLVLFSPAVSDRIGDAGPPVYVASTGAVLIAVLRNLAIAGMPIVAVGAASNLLAIVANGGFMPANPAALASIGRAPGGGYSNDIVSASPVLAPLTDQFVLPHWLPLANVFSIGDVLIATGLAVLIVVAMRRTGAEPATAVEHRPESGH
jgi:hypothetical protein